MFERRVVQLVAVGDEDLAAHEIDAGHDFGDGVLDLDARVDLDEVELAAIDVEQELDRAGVPVADRAAQPRRGIADPAAQIVGEVDARRDLDDFLMAALDRAVALPEVHEVAVRVAEDLHLDVLGARDVALEEHVGPAERRLRLALRLFELGLQLVRALHDAHPAAAAAEAGLDDQRIADPLGHARTSSAACDRLLRAGNRRDAGLLREALRRGLVAERFELVGGRADERMPASSHARASAAFSERNP